MSRKVDVKALISHIVKGDGADKCRICMGDTSEGQVYLSDTVMMDQDRSVTLAEVIQMTTGVEVEAQIGLPRKVCAACYASVAGFLPFLRLCKDADYQWHRITDYIDDMEIAKVNKTKSVYIVVDESNIELVTNSVLSRQKRPRNPAEVVASYKARLRADDRKKRWTKRIVCVDCNARFSTPLKYNIHIQHTKYRMCSVCSEMINLEDLRTHLASHDVELHECTECHDAFVTKHHLDIHVERKHKYPEGNKCVECQASFKNLISLLSHSRVHEQITCPACDKWFTNRYCHKYHLKQCKGTGKHRRVRQYICDYCSKCFSKRAAISSHIQFHHLKWQKIQCEQCGKKFPSLTQLKEHGNMHNNVPDRFKCDLCPAKYSTRRGYELHRKKHSYRSYDDIVKNLGRNKKNDVPESHSCDLCPAKFKTKTAFDAHYKKRHVTVNKQKIREPETYACDKCPAKYKNKRNFNLHCMKHRAAEEEQRKFFNQKRIVF